MKFQKSILVLICLFVISCDKDDEEVKPSIVGSWTATSIARDNCWNGNDRSVDFDCDNNFCMEYTFNSDGTTTNTYTDPNSGVSNYEGIYTLTGNELTVCDSDGSNCTTVTTSISGNTLKLMFFEEEEEGSSDGCDVTMNLIRV